MSVDAEAREQLTLFTTLDTDEMDAVCSGKDIEGHDLSEAKDMYQKIRKQVIVSRAVDAAKAGCKVAMAV